MKKKSKTSTLTLRFDADNTKLLDSIKKLTHESTGAGAILRTMKEYVDLQKEHALFEKQLDQLENKYETATEILNNFRSSVKRLLDSKIPLSSGRSGR